jgi:mannose-6-phosphate isomerase-like protein (cupin superfamily)
MHTAQKCGDPTRTCRTDIAPYTTKDGSEIRELFHPQIHGNKAQSLAEATVQPGCETRLHKHLRSEELYHIVSGQGSMTLADRVFPVKAGDTVCILPGLPHLIKNIGNKALIILCCCSPPYSHPDTELL